MKQTESKVIDKSQFPAIYAKALAAGKAAGSMNKPVPMVVSEVADPIASYALGVNEAPEPGGKSWYVSEGACGFAWVNVKPGNSAFAKWLVKMGLARGAYGGGVDIWISDYNQSMSRKEAHANAMARVLREQGIERAFASSRMD